MTTTPPTRLATVQCDVAAARAAESRMLIGFAKYDVDDENHLHTAICRRTMALAMQDAEPSGDTLA